METIYNDPNPDNFEKAWNLMYESCKQAIEDARIKTAQKSSKDKQAQIDIKKWDDVEVKYIEIMSELKKVVINLRGTDGVRKAPTEWKYLIEESLKIWEIFIETTPITDPVYVTGIMARTLVVIKQYSVIILGIINQ